eukprot:322045-Prymnesium_polylepis.1
MITPECLLALLPPLVLRACAAPALPPLRPHLCRTAGARKYGRAAASSLTVVQWQTREHLVLLRWGMCELESAALTRPQILLRISESEWSESASFDVVV